MKDDAPGGSDSARRRATAFDETRRSPGERRGEPSLISPLEPPSIIGYTMESLEIVVLPVALIGALLLSAIWTTVALHWLRSTERLH